MSISVDDIITKARELSLMIQLCPVALRYRDSLKAITGDKKAQLILEQLYNYGKAVKNGTPDTLSKTEHAMLQKDLESNPLVKKYLMNQREYLNLLDGILERIKNPL